MYAVDDLSDAIDATREFLTPISLGLVLKLALIVFFVSSLGFSGPGVPVTDPGMVADDPTQTGTQGESQESIQELYEEETGEEFPVDQVIAVALVFVAILFGIGLIYLFIQAILEFVFIESLRSEEVHVRRYFLENVGRGFRLFVFRVVLNAIPVAIAGGLLYYQFTGGDVLDQLTGATLWGALAAGIVFVLAYSIILGFTAKFVAPIMLLEDRGVLSAWSRFWATFKANWAEYVVYLVLAWIIMLVITITAWFVIAIAGFILAIPFAILAFVLFVLLADLGVIGGIVFTVFMIGAFLAFLLLLSVIWTPITVYFRYYALLLLGDTNDDLDLIPDLRGALRGTPVGTAGGAGTAGRETESGWDDGTRDGYDSETDESWSTTEPDDDDGFEWYETRDSTDESVDADGSVDDGEPDANGESDRDGSTDAREDRDEKPDDDDGLDDRGW
ncbi:hypothetical protein EL22_16750 [Halostagnicola sp. A56]|uniref:DUF7544 domain-containing protein n=1 Tax=Halostagnicola sp. A56 TaxID=1495067 RepID=UPI00049FFD27|nr:hypothetical protein [Halostagnicola sp. A56]KDE59829.1 hypothetical protein EL22_16750 [Halostagnicola sp. A56]